MSVLLLVLACLALVLPALPFVRDRERKRIDDAVRASTPGRFVELSQGWVHYDLVGPDDGDLVVLVHGFSTPYYIWDEQAPALTGAGFRVLRYDLYGRGFSDRPDVVYGQDLYDRQLAELLAAVAPGAKVHLVGLSMGGAISVEFADRHPGSVASLALVDPAGYPVNVPASARLIELPLLGGYLMKTVGDKILLDSNEKSVHRKELVPALREKFAVQLAYKGFKRAILSTLRNMPLENMGATFERVGRSKLPSLLFWGRQDEVVDFANAARVQAALPDVEFHAIEGAGHLPHYERPEVVNPLLLDFLGRQRMSKAG